MYTHRPVNCSDFEEIALFPQDARELFFMYPKGIYPLTPGQLEEAAKSRVNATVILSDKYIVGYSNLYDVTEEECWLGNVIIHPNYRSKGAGRYLVETMIHIARMELKIKHFRLVCHNINTKALLFYTKLGFKPFDLKIMQDQYGNELVGIKLEAGTSVDE
ncbi:GNAT family N-acetyltransferase [Paenibacillus turpanensis]|uniref:GNAT family N-acetyltransferase n=1 Tax=Paenibacillus turpanensis TaxID=2689078 RepID=UPI00140DFA42|nr:GNAT family N-acetyltransferase [Paenibacillus turpanensis]